MDQLTFLLATGLARGAVFALFALSLVLIWRAARIINFAQGAQALVAAYVAFTVTSASGSYWAGLISALVAGALIGVAVERGVMRLVPAHDHLAGIIVAIGIVMVLQSLLGILFGPQYRPMQAPFDDSPLMIGDTPLLSPYDIFVLTIAAVTMVALGLLFRFTSIGLQLRAAAFAPEVSRLLGVRVPRMVTIGWMLSSAVASLAAFLLVPTELGLNPHATDMLLVYGFAVAVIGGLDSPLGALAAGLTVGVVVTLVSGYVSATLAPMGLLVLLLGVLLVRPGGIFSMREVRSA
jgi:branched-chain amino acid transport system permease protein